MKKLSILLMISFLILTGCQTTLPESNKIEIPDFTLSAPARPTLENIPSDPEDAIKALTKNLSRLTLHVEKWELYNRYKDEYFRSLITILNN